MTAVRVGAPASLTDPNVLRHREALPAELALETFLERRFVDLLKEARRTGVCDEEDLIAMGWALFDKLCALARGEVSAISVEKRLPCRGEFGSLTAAA